MDVACSSEYLVLFCQVLWHHVTEGYSFNVKCLAYVYREVFNPLKPNSYVMHQQFNIQQL